MNKQISIWKKILIVSLAVIAVAVVIIVGMCAYDFFDRKLGNRYYPRLDTRVSEYITMIHGTKGGRSYCQLKDVRTGEFTTPRLNHVFINEAGEDSLVVFRTCDRKRGFLNINTGKIVIPAQYDRAWNFREGLAAVIKDGEISFLNSDGELAFPTTFPMRYDDDFIYYAFMFHNGLCAMLNTERKWGLIDNQGNWVVEPIYTRLDKPQYGYRVVSDGVHYGLLTEDGHVALPLEYDYIRPASTEKGFRVTKDGCAKIIDTNLNTIVPFVYDRIFKLSCAGTYDYDEYDEDEIRSTDIATYRRYDVGEGSGIIDQHGNVIIPAKYFMVRIVNENLFEVEVDCDGDKLLFNKKGQYVGKSNF